MKEIYFRIVSALVLSSTCSFAVYKGGDFFLWYLCFICVWSTIECLQLLQSFSGYFILILITIFPTSMFYIRSKGVFILLRFFITVWSSDIFAYVCGNIIGGPKIWTEISPKKTYSGTIGGIFCGALVGYFLNLLFIEALCISIFTQIGDMLESYSKRKACIKDSDNLIHIPGHGGILDRIDGLLCATPIYVLILLNKK